MDNNIRTTSLCHCQKDEVALAKAKTQVDFYIEGTGQFDLLSVAFGSLKSSVLVLVSKRLQICRYWLFLPSENVLLGSCPENRRS